MPDVLEKPFAIAMVVLGLGLIIFLHELGHFIMAKRNGVRVEIFSLGFGPAIFSFRRGDTEYRLSWIPLGGYVKMTGESLAGDRSGEPFELTSKTPWQRFQIFVAGALMNLLIAFPIAFLSCFLGLYQHSSEVAGVGMQEAAADMRPGDVIVEVNGRKIDSLAKYHIEMISRWKGDRIPVKVERLEEGKPVLKELVVTVESSQHHKHTGPPTLMPLKLTPGSPAALAGIAPDHEIISVDGERLYDPLLVEERLRKNPGQAKRLGIRRRDGVGRITDTEVTVTPPARTVYSLQDDHLQECIIGLLVPGTPAWGKLNLDDVIERINDKPVASFQDLKDIVEVSPNQPLRVHVKGVGAPVEITPAWNSKGKGSLGVQMKATARFADVREGTSFHAAGVRTGDILRSIDGAPGVFTLPGTEKTPGVFAYREEKPRTIKIQVEREGHKDKWIPLEIPLQKVEEGDLAALGFGLERGRAIGKSMYFRERTFAEAVQEGMREPVDITVTTVEVLRKLILGDESPKGLSGPVGIFTVSYQFALLSPGNFLWILCLITVNLGVFNLLPIPVLDGGHNLLLLIEVVRKKFGKPPPSEKFVATFQYVGLILILFLVVYVTVNDIGRL